MAKTTIKSIEKLNQTIVKCNRCPRLLKHCRSVANLKRKSFQDETYWGLPIENFGDPQAKLLIIGLAPAAHGANRTGRMFTGDRSGLWLYRALHRAGFATQPESISRHDDLKLPQALITAVAHCAPPDNKPLPDEIENCRDYLQSTFEILQPKVLIALGGIAWKATLQELKRRKWLVDKAPEFGHGRRYELEGGRVLIGSYHPSQQNTFTGRLTEPMFDAIFTQAKKDLALPHQA